jgi:hypothetical protein
MNQPPASQYLLLLRHYGTMPSPTELQKIMQKFAAWTAGIKARGQLVGTHGLQFTGKTIRTHGVVSDGPFAEAKEIVGGYLLITAADLDEAIGIAKACPGLEQPGTSVEVRPLQLASRG